MNETKKIQQILIKIKSNKKLAGGLLIFLLLILFGLAFAFWRNLNTVYIEKAELKAPVSAITAKTGGILEESYVHIGDILPANTVLVRVGNELIKTEEGGLVISLRNDFGSQIKSGETVASLIQPSEFRVVGRLDEDKGLSNLSVGQTAAFTLSAFGRQKFFGVIDEISPVSRDSDITFNISDKKESKIFEVKIRFDQNSLPELRQGLSAEVWINIR